MNCTICGLQTKNKKYCSEKCQYLGYKKDKIEREERTCIFCDQIFLIRKTKKNKYCSRSCADNHKKTTMIGEKNHRYNVKESEATKKKRSLCMKLKWQEKKYRQNRANAFIKAMEKRQYWFGNDPVSIEKRKTTIIKKYGKHPFQDKEYREKCNNICLKLYGKSALEMAQEAITDEVIENRRRSLIETVTGVTYEQYEQALTEKEKYYKQVKRITESQNIETLPNYEKRALAGKEDAYHLDHIIPIFYGLINKIDPNIIGNINNLRFIPAIDNIKKGCKYNDKECKEI